MHRAIITEQLSNGRTLPFTKLTFEMDKKNYQSHLTSRSSTNRTKDIKCKASGIAKNLEVVLKLSQTYSPSTDFAQTFNSKMYTSQTISSSRPQQKTSSAKRMFLKSALLKPNKKQSEGEVNFSPIKVNNYKCFPKREVRLKNNNPYRFYMFSKNGEKLPCFEDEPIRRKNNRFGNGKISNVCAFTKDSNLMGKRRAHTIDVRYERREDMLQPWNQSREDKKEDSVLFQ